jgi:hypothetical protein
MSKKEVESDIVCRRVEGPAIVVLIERRQPGRGRGRADTEGSGERRVIEGQSGQLGLREASVPETEGFSGASPKRCFRILRIADSFLSIPRLADIRPSPVCRVRKVRWAD